MNPELLLQAASAFRRLNDTHKEVVAHTGTNFCGNCKEHWPCDVATVIVTVTQLMASYQSDG
jgi:hypothetical protein